MFRFPAMMVCSLLLAALALTARMTCAQVPAAPVIAEPHAGDGTAYVAFRGPDAAGGSPITAYTATCNAGVGDVSANALTSPIVVGGLTNGLTYACSVTASNAQGLSAPSASVSITPQANVPLALIGVASRKIHGPVGVFDLPIDPGAAIDGSLSVDSRTPNAAHQLIFKFNATVTSMSPVLVTDEGSVILGAGAAMAGNEIAVSLAGLPDNKRVLVTIATVNGVTLNASAPAAYLVGDVNRTRSVTPADLTMAKSRAGQFSQPGNFHYDINASGAVTAADLAALKARNGRNLPNASAPVVARVEIDQTGLLLDAAGATRQLSAAAFNAANQRINVPVSWTSSRPGNLTVNSAGLVTAQTGNGVSQITASAGGKTSAPLLAVVTQPAAGAVLLTDAQIVGDPVETTPGAVPAFTNTYRVSLTGVAAPAVGTLLISTESKPVAGRVVAVDFSGNPILVTMKLEPFKTLFPSLVLDEVLDLSNAPVTVTQSLASSHDFVRNGNTFTFTAKASGMKAPGAASTGLHFGSKAPPVSGRNTAGTAALPDFGTCEATGTGVGGSGPPPAPLPIGLAAPPLLSISITPTLDLQTTGTGELQRLVINAEPTIKFEGGIGITAAFEGKIECKVQLFEFKIPVAGPLAFFFGGVVPVGMGMEVAGKVTVATMSIGTKVEVKARAKAGIDCPGGMNCAFERGLDNFVTTVTPTFNGPSVGDIRLEPSLSAYGTADFEVGNPFLKSIRFEAVKLKVGAKLAGAFASKTSQLADPLFAASYGVSLEAGASLGGSITNALALFGLSSVSGLELALSFDLAKSPSGLAMGSVTADKETFVSGDTVNFTVKLDPATLDFFPGFGPYNVQKVQLVRSILGTPTVVGAVNAVPGDHTFNFTFNASNVGNVGEFSAFLVTALVPFDLFALEVGKATVTAPTSNNMVSVNVSESYPSCDGVGAGGFEGQIPGQNGPGTAQSIAGPPFPIVAQVGSTKATLIKVNATTFDLFYESNMTDDVLSCPEAYPPGGAGAVFAHGMHTAGAEFTVFFAAGGTVTRIIYDEFSSINDLEYSEVVEPGNFVTIGYYSLGLGRYDALAPTPFDLTYPSFRKVRFTFTPAPTFP